jgi:hypothetical protein
MNIFDLGTLIAIIFCAFFVGKCLALSFGVLGWIIGVFIGGSIPILMRQGLFFFLFLFLDKYFPSRPPCKNGTCHAHDYSIIEYIAIDRTVLLRCKCGTKYVQRFPYFMELLEDGTPKPYMKKIWGIWKPDKEENEEISKNQL